MIVELPAPPSVNALYRNVPGRGRVRTREYKRWLAAAGWTLAASRIAPIKGPVRLRYSFGCNRRADLGNLEKATTDLLVKLGLIEDDGPSIVRHIDLRWDPGVEGVRVVVEGVTA